jgi:hypothetical protein
MMEIPINARLEGEAKVTQYNDLLTKRLDAL